MIVNSMINDGEWWFVLLHNAQWVLMADCRGWKTANKGLYDWSLTIIVGPSRTMYIYIVQWPEIGMQGSKFEPPSENDGKHPRGTKIITCVKRWVPTKKPYPHNSKHDGCPVKYRCASIMDVSCPRRICGSRAYVSTELAKVSIWTSWSGEVTIHKAIPLAMSEQYPERYPKEPKIGIPLFQFRNPFLGHKFCIFQPCCFQKKKGAGCHPVRQWLKGLFRPWPP